MNRHLSFGGTFLIAVTSMTVAYVAGRAGAQGIPATKALTFSGELTDSTGVPLSGTKSIQVVLVDTASGTPTQQCGDLAAQVVLAGGAFKVTLPDSCKTLVASKADLWVEVFVDGTSFGRTKLGAVPYAVETDHATSATNATNATTAQRAISSDAASSASGALDVRIKALEKPAPGFDVLSTGFSGCTALPALAVAGAKNVLIQADSLFSDPACATSVLGVSCHPFCAAFSISNPASFGATCCEGVGVYYTKGLVQILAYQP